MTGQQRELLARAVELHRPLARAARMGRANGGGYVVFGSLSLMFSVLGPDVIGLAMGAVLIGAGLVERAGAARLRQADPTAPLFMARAELAVMAAVVIYGILGLTVLPSLAQELRGQIDGMEELGLDIVEISRSVTTLWYALVIALGLVYQGGMARAFLRRREPLERYLDEIPEWARSVVESMD
jgi:hypothetical protein